MPEFFEGEMNAKDFSRQLNAEPLGVVQAWWHSLMFILARTDPTFYTLQPGAWAWRLHFSSTAKG